MYGQIDDKNSLFMCITAGKAGDDKQGYELMTHINGSMLLRSNQTKKYFTLGWQDFIRLAIEAGIDKE